MTARCTRLAQTVREVVREIDSAGRWGGEEFALILPGTDVAGGVVVAERVQDSLASRKIEAVNGEDGAHDRKFRGRCVPE